MPSRKNLVKIIFFSFIVAFFGFLAWYLAPAIISTFSSGNADAPEETDFSFFPFGNNNGSGAGNTNSENTGSTNNGSESNTIVGKPPRFREVAEGPVAAYFPYANTPLAFASGSSSYVPTITNVRYLEGDTGHVYDTATDEVNANRLSNTTVANIGRAIFSDEDNIFIRYMDDFGNRKTFAAKLVNNLFDESTAVKKLQGFFFPDGITELALAPSGNKVLYLQENSNNPDGSVVGVTSDISGENKKQVFNSDITHWSISWPSSSQALFTTKATYASFGVGHVLNINTNAFKPKVPGTLGMITKSNKNLTSVITSGYFGNSYGVQILNSDGTFISTDMSTLASKCVFATNTMAYCAVPTEGVGSQMPDLYYQGIESFSDELWSVNTTTGQTRVVFSPVVDAGKNIDMTNLQLSPDGQYIYFQNKTDLGLWSYQLIVPE